MTGQNLIEKITQRFAVGLDKDHVVHSGDFISIRPAHILTHDNTGAVMNKFKAIGATKMADPRQMMFALDHRIQDTGEENMKKYASIESFAKDMDVDFYPAGRGIGHQIMCEEGYVWPGGMAVASDSHSNMYGGLGCLGTPVVRTDAAAIWATGRTWWQIPPVAKINLIGKLNKGVTGKDVIIALCGYFNNDEVLNHALEFAGDGITELSIDQRLTIANMTTEWGALAGLFPIDTVTIDWLKKRTEFVAKRGLAGVPSDKDGNGTHPRLNQKRIKELIDNPIKPDNDAEYATEITIHLESVQPYIAGPDNLKTTAPALEMRKKNIKIHKAYLVSCVNSRVEDIAEAAAVLKGKNAKKVAEGVEFYMAAASSEVQAEAEKRGDWQALLKAGAIPLPPGCGPCIGLGKGLLGDNEVGISATNRNFKGRMGSKSSKAYLASPAVVAASAIAGIIDLPDGFTATEIRAERKVSGRSAKASGKVKILDGFPETIEGELIFCYQDNLNTDGIFPGKYTYIDDFTPEQQAEVVMENYDPDFVKLVQKGDILIGSFNFGSGSSREQAATALKYCGIQLLMAGSFSETYKRNAINNGFLVIEIPKLANDLKSRFGEKKLTVRTGIDVKIDFAKSIVIADGVEYNIGPVGTAAQELIIIGGLENWVKKNINI